MVEHKFVSRDSVISTGNVKKVLIIQNILRLNWHVSVLFEFCENKSRSIIKMSNPQTKLWDTMNEAHKLSWRQMEISCSEPDLKVVYGIYLWKERKDQEICDSNIVQNSSVSF